MLLPGYRFMRIALISTVFFFAVSALPYPEEDKTFNLKIGFDLTNGENGAPSLRIRDFEESKEFNPRAEDRMNTRSDKSDNAAISSDTDDGDTPKKDSSNESNNAKPLSAEPKSAEDTDENSDSDSDAKDKHSTRGLLPREYEPEDKNPKLHGRNDDDDDDERRRSKRSAAKYFAMKKKNKKASKMFRKMGIDPRKTYKSI